MKYFCRYSALTTITLAVSYRLLERTALQNIGHMCVWIHLLARSSGARSEPEHHLLMRYPEFRSVGQQILSIITLLASRRRKKEASKSLQSQFVARSRYHINSHGHQNNTDLSV